jgi:zinc transport system ATP-binding protein
VDNNIVVSFDSVFFSYGNLNVLSNVSFHIHGGEFVAMVGPNGSGKTTLLKLLLGLEKPNTGKIESSGSAAYVSQYMPSDNLFPITVYDIVKMGMLYRFKRHSNRELKDTVEEILKIAGIEDLAQRQYRLLSGGQKRRVLVARALAAKPQILVLDEPAANMDIESEQLLYKTLGEYKGKTTIFVVTHDTEYVSSLTDRVLCLGDGGKVVQHRTESGVSRHGAGYDARVLHDENISCC